ncbi:phosphoribosylaminoimidazolesuccinocarboxamide synthase [Nitrososphaera viennensis]|uniref:Phosphoribosylaminoimidazole-succinocarboxamide synthase n=2 Tax=Nitrososphaera viennensis TaxID=1034015 RepID=A0A060HH76_9ARCH|nr:phosphoribosylaminoimidazolesuccinocarboxamide synthase [Nitrososphaera viennensis]AIC14715.1 phosphoribosylaminoimidazole-succinocarboxamide synthase [Nitrososphaera viennensis EN76]UVS69678.1 phosphoribosylaminoimidazolesuccinocarboxamide synthase [Nitrososphaera viennensis]
MRLIRKGKVKDIYELDDDGNNILFHFSDRVSAFDVKMATPIPRKGEVLCRFGEFWFNTLGTPHHMLRVQDKDKMVVKKLAMIPVECVVRGYFYGSFADRYKDHLGKSLPADYKPVMAGRLPRPIFDPTTKSEEHDMPVNKEQAISMGLVSKEDYEFLEKTSILLYEKMSAIVEKAGFIIADVKFEFGRDESGRIVLGDSLGPDEYRLWLKADYSPGRMQEAYDKQLLRDWLIKTGFKAEIDRLAKEGKKPEPPTVAPEIAGELSRRYILAYERISGRTL